MTACKTPCKTLRSVLRLVFALAAFTYPAIGFPRTSCPTWWRTDWRVRDLVRLSDVVSWDGGFEKVPSHQGSASFWLQTQMNGVYDTRMRVYSRTSPNETVIVFRPTQATPEGQAIHANRRLVPCALYPGCTGLVHERMQEATLSLMKTVDWDALLHNASTVWITGHSLGGALSLMASVVLRRANVVNADRPLAMVLGLAGPFVGDETFVAAETATTSFPSFQVETIDAVGKGFDGTVEGYNVDQPPFIYINTSRICGVEITPLSDSYGLHDLRNYALWFQG